MNSSCLRIASALADADLAGAIGINPGWPEVELHEPCSRTPERRRARNAMCVPLLGRATIIPSAEGCPYRRVPHEEAA